MVVCICRVVSDRTIEAAIAGGAKTFEEVAAATRAGSDCGCCRDAIRGMVESATSCGNGCPDCPRRASKMLHERQ